MNSLYRGLVPKLRGATGDPCRTSPAAETSERGAPAESRRSMPRMRLSRLKHAPPGSALWVGRALACPARAGKWPHSGRRLKPGGSQDWPMPHTFFDEDYAAECP